MKNILPLVIIFTLCTLSYTDDCSFSLENICSTIQIDANSQCIYLEGKCVKSFYVCENYAPDSNFDDKICESIIPTDTKKKCVAKNVNSLRKCVTEDRKCEEFKVISDCFNLAVEDSEKQRCVLVDGNKCETHYKECADVTNSGICNQNIPNDNKKKCQWSSNTCGTVDRTCDDYIVFDDNTIQSVDCPSLNADDAKVCFLDNSNNCKSYYKECEHGTQNDCISIKPFIEGTTEYNINAFNQLAHCVWEKKDGEENASCHEENWKCNEVTGEENKDYCPNFELSNSNSKKGCVYDQTNKKCSEEYTDCQDYSDDPTVETKVPETCEAIKIITSVSNSYLYSCKLEGTSCTPKKKKCTDVTGEENKDYCPELDLSNPKKVCVYDETNKKCSEVYPTCQSYTEDTTVTTKDKGTCEAIKISESESDHYSCVLNGNTCEQKRKECKEINVESICNAHIFDNTDGTSKQNKKCTFLSNNTCVETYKKCSYYQEDDSIETKSKNICEIIPIFEDTESGKTFLYNCTFDDEKGCQKNKIECDYYKGDSETCNLITPNLDDSKYQCKSNNGKCFKQFGTCSNFNFNNPDDDDIEQNKQNCESIILSTSYMKCYLEHDKTCKETRKLCSEYLGNNENECKNYIASDNNKQCALVNNKCIEVDIIVPDPDIYYYYCSDYRGTDKAICESILPHTETTFNGGEISSIDYSYKCVYDSSIGCVRKKKECSDAKSEYECQYIYPEDTDQQCAYINNNCVQQYKSCSVYQQKVGNSMTRGGCENIRVSETEGTNTYTYLNSYCEYKETSGTKTCTRKSRECEDISTTLIQSIAENQCTSLTNSISDLSKRCIYKSNNCVSQAKTCKELFYISDSITSSLLESICEDAPTSSDKKVCRVNHSNNGCEETDPEIEPSNTDSNTNAQTNDDKRFYNLSKMIFALIYLLI